MHRREFLLSATGIVGATTVGSIAYTSATVKRDVTSVVSEDANAVIGLSPGSTSAVTKSNGKLVVKDRSLQTVDESEILGFTREQSLRLWSRMKKIRK